MQQSAVFIYWLEPCLKRSSKYYKHKWNIIKSLNGLLTVAAGVMLKLVGAFRFCPVTAPPDETPTGKEEKGGNIETLLVS